MKYPEEFCTVSRFYGKYPEEDSLGNFQKSFVRSTRLSRKYSFGGGYLIPFYHEVPQAGELWILGEEVMEPGGV